VRAVVGPRRAIALVWPADPPRGHPPAAGTALATCRTPRSIPTRDTRIMPPDRRRLVRHRLAAFVRDAAGVNLVEAAIITPLLLALTFSIVDFAGLFYAYLALENGVSQATRYAVTGQVAEDPDKPGTKLSREESIKLAMRTSTPTLTLPDAAFTFKHRSMNGGAWLPGAGDAGDIVKVTIAYDWSLWTPFVGSLFPNGGIKLITESAMKNEEKFD
jgi:hypothetical protein